MPTESPAQARPYPKVEAWIRMILGFLAVAFYTVPAMLAALLVLPSRRLRVRIGNLYGKACGRTALWLAGTRPVVHHWDRLASQRPAIYVTNHASVLDVFLGMWLCPFGGVGTGKKEVLKIPFFGQAFWLTGHILLDRNNRGNAIAALDRAARAIAKNGLSLYIWPEGTRARDGRLLPFKKGFAHLAIATGLPVVPVVTHGAHLRWPNRSFQLIPGDLHVEVLEAVDTSTWTLETLDQNLADLRQIFLEHLPPDQRTLPEPIAAAS